MISEKTIEDLTLLYLQNQDLSDVTPDKLIEKYLEVKAELSKAANPQPPKAKVSSRFGLGI